MTLSAIGMLTPGRKYSATNSYGYGFNGKENDNEVKGEGDLQDYGMSIYDPRLGRFLSVDPLTQRYAELTPYQFASNTPARAIDLDGGEMKDVNEFGWGNESTRQKDIYERCAKRDGNEWILLPAALVTFTTATILSGGSTLSVSGITFKSVRALAVSPCVDLCDRRDTANSFTKINVH